MFRQNMFKVPLFTFALPNQNLSDDVWHRPLPKGFQGQEIQANNQRSHSKKEVQTCDSIICRLEKHALSKEDFAFIMRNLPVPVAESEIDEMFEFADKNQDGKLSFAEFELMVI